MFKGSIWQIVPAEKLKCGKGLALWKTGNGSVALWEGIYFIGSGVSKRKRRREKASKCVLCLSNNLKFNFNIQRCDHICTYSMSVVQEVSMLFSVRVCTSCLQCVYSLQYACLFILPDEPTPNIPSLHLTPRRSSAGLLSCVLLNHSFFTTS